METIRQEQTCICIPFCGRPLAHTGQLMLRERQQKETNLRYNQPIVMTRVPIPPVAGRIIIQ